jgi:hypothetical protein
VTAALPPAGRATALPGTLGDLTSPVAPRYRQASLGDVVPGALAALGVPGSPDPLRLAEGALAGVRRVVMLLVDGLGAAQLPAAAALAPTLAELATGRLAAATTLTCGFPSTTPVSVATVGTGAPPGEHGIVGFAVAVPGTDRVLNHIEWGADPPPEQWQPVPTLFERAARAGVAVSVLSRPEFAGSGLTVAAYRGARYQGVADPASLAGALLRAATAADPPVLVFGYLPEVDRAGHCDGVGSAAWRAAVGQVEGVVRQLLDGLPDDAALLVTADHGQLNIPAEGRLDADTDPRLRQGVRTLAGEPRVRYLHTVAGARDDVLATWRELLGASAWVVSRDEAVATGWYGPVAEDHLERIGDVVVACRDRRIVVASKAEPAFVAGMVGHHGSFTADEMLIPLLVGRNARS